ncbi:MAG: amino acid ABC transporter substrate-binding protein [Alphaproteobacteria bacterium]|nr:amino acid ABC transporter substrate-binding protein [Alphaproteobacteria bacterium]
MRRLLASLVLVMTAPLALAQDDGAPTMTIGYLDMAEDPRYDEWGIHPVDIRSSTAIVDRRGLAGAELGMEDLSRLKRVAKTSFAMDHARVTNTAGILSEIARMREAGAAVFVLDAPSKVLVEVSAALAAENILLLNATAIGDSLRNEDCQTNLFHVAASRAMLTDALAQHLKERNWQEIIVLQGPLAEDVESVAAFTRSADLFGLEIVDARLFVLGNDPRAREMNDLDFLTGSEDYDAVFVADVHGEFALSVPHRTRKPAPVVGASGLVPRIWHWSYTRHGAPQVHGRFERLHSRRMGEADWGAWVSMKAIGEAVARTKSRNVADIRDYFRSEKMRVDGSKGPGMSFRIWNNQLRQPIMLATQDWVSARAPIEGFKHRTNDLDTLGQSEREMACGF